MSLAAIPWALRTSCSRVIAVLFDSSALAAVWAWVVTPTWTTARSGAAEIFPVPETEIVCSAAKADCVSATATHVKNRSGDLNMGSLLNVLKPFPTPTEPVERDGCDDDVLALVAETRVDAAVVQHRHDQASDQRAQHGPLAAAQAAAADHDGRDHLQLQAVGRGGISRRVEIDE